MAWRAVWWVGSPMVTLQRSRFPRRKGGTVWIGSGDQGGDLPDIFVDLSELVGRDRAFDLYSRGVSRGFSPRRCGTCEEQGLGGDLWSELQVLVLLAIGSGTLLCWLESHL